MMLSLEEFVLLLFPGAHSTLLLLHKCYVLPHGDTAVGDLTAWGWRAPIGQCLCIANCPNHSPRLEKTYSRNQIWGKHWCHRSPLRMLHWKERSRVTSRAYCACKAISLDLFPERGIQRTLCQRLESKKQEILVFPDVAVIIPSTIGQDKAVSSAHQS